MLGNQGGLFIGALKEEDKKFVTEVLREAHKAGYEYFIEPCAGALAMSYAAIDAGWEPDKIEASDVSYFSGAFARGVCGLTTEDMEIKAQGFSREELLDPATALYAQVYLRMSRKSGTEYFSDLQREINKLATPSVEFAFKIVTFTFMNHQMRELNELIKAVGSSDFVGVADIDQFKPFVEALSDTKKYEDVKAIGAAIAKMIQVTNDEITGRGLDRNSEWQPIAKLFGSGAVSREDGDIIENAIKKAIANKEIGQKEKYKLMVKLCEEYLERE